MNKIKTGIKLAKRLYHQWKADSYMEYYQKNSFLNEDYKEWVGPAEAFNLIGDWQLEKMKQHGLTPNNSMLDIGCGVLRGGQRFIKYLEPGKYVGIDIKKKAIKKSKERIKKLDLEDKDPLIFQNKKLNFEEEEFTDRKFDFILAQSVFTHLPKENIKTCIENINKIMDEDSVFLATFNRSYKLRKNGALSWGFKQPLSFYKEICRENNLKVEQVFSGQPCGQELLKIQKR